MTLEPSPARPQTANQTYNGLDVEKFLKEIGLRRVRDHANGWVTFRCPFHDDRRPSAAMHRLHTKWRCHACGCSGNATVLLAMLKGITTKQAHARIMARNYNEQVPESAGYKRKTRRAATGSKADLSAQTEHAIELRQKGVPYNRTKEVLIALYGISERTAERRLKVAKQYLEASSTRYGLGTREAAAVPLRFVKASDWAERHSVPIKRKNPVSYFEELEILQKRPLTRAGKGGSTKTENLTVTRTRTRRLAWPGASWQRPRTVRPGVYHELADGRVVHETHTPKAEIDWLATGSITTVTEPEP